MSADLTLRRIGAAESRKVADRVAEKMRRAGVEVKVERRGHGWDLVIEKPYDVAAELGTERRAGGRVMEILMEALA